MILSLSSMRAKLALAVTGLALVALPATFNFAQAAPASGPSVAPPPATAPASMTFDPILASIDGRDIKRDEFLNTLEAIAGMRFFESQIVPYVLASEACSKAGIRVTDEDVQAEKNRILDNIKDQATKAGQKDITQQQLEGAFQKMMEDRGAAPVEVAMTLQRAACLRKLAQAVGKINVTDDQVKKAFDAEFGPKVQIVDIIVADMASGADIRDIIVNKKKPIADALTEKKPLNAQGFLVPANAEGVQPELKQKAFALEKDGDMSEVVMIKNEKPAEGAPPFTYHLIYLQKKIAADPKAVYDQVTKDRIRKQLIDAEESRWGNEHLQNLRAQAHINIKDPILSAQYQIYYNRMQAATQAASQPATAPAALTPK